MNEVALQTDFTRCIELSRRSSPRHCSSVGPLNSFLERFKKCQRKSIRFFSGATSKYAYAQPELQCKDAVAIPAEALRIRFRARASGNSNSRSDFSYVFCADGVWWYY